MISRRPDFVGRSKWSRRSNRPGRRSAGSRSSARLVAAISRMLLTWACAVGMRLSDGRYAVHPLRHAAPCTRTAHGGWSNDCIWISSSFTTPEPSPAPHDA